MRILFICLLLSGYAALCPAAGPGVTPKITEVTVYPAGAKLSSTATVKVPAGASEVVFENLSPYFNGNSLQVRIKGDARLNAAVFQMRVPGPGPEHPRAQVLRDSLVLLSDELIRHQNEREVLNEELNMIRTNQARVATSATGQITTLSVNELRELTEYYTRRLKAVKDRELELLILQRAIGAEQTRCRQELTRLQPNTANSTGEIVLKLDATTAQSLEITCTYLVYNAGWTPLYDIRSAGLDKPLQLIYKANVRNSTGFDWKDVMLHLSTAQPLADNNRPVLTPVFVDFRPVAAYREQAQNRAEAANMYTLSEVVVTDAEKTDDVSVSGYGAGKPVLPVPEEPAPEEDNFIANFDLPRPQNIPADGKDNIVTADEQDLPAEYEYHAVPKLQPAVFLLAKVADYGRYNLLPGTANIFFEDTYVGQTWVDPGTTSDTLLLSLGRDEQISIQRLQPKDFKERTKIFNTKVRVTYVFEITVKNNKSDAISVNILDQIPVSRQKDILVTLEDKDGAGYDSDFGKLEWTLSVPPGKSKKVRFRYTIEHPKDKPVTLLRA